MSTAVYFDKYDAGGAYHWMECDRRLSNWKLYNPALDARYKITTQAVASVGLRGALLDVGCGDGMLMACVASLMDRVTGVDSEASAIRWAKERLQNFPNCEAIHTSCYELPFTRQSFEVVTSADVIEHLKDPSDHLKEICRVLKPNGALVLTTPKWRASGKWDARHEKEYHAEELRALLENNFGIITLKFFWPAKWTRFYSTKVGWRLLKFAAILGWNPFFRSGNESSQFGQMLVVCRQPKQ